MKFTAKLLLEAISKVAPTALTGDDAVDLSLELSYFDLLIIVSHLNKLQPAYSRDLPMNCEQMDTLMSY
jgi:hypothetical protein